MARGSAKKGILLFFMVGCCCGWYALSHRQYSKPAARKAAPLHRDVPQLKVEDIPTFFESYVRTGGVRKGVFETEQDFQKRVSCLPQLDPQQLVYFPVVAGRFGGLCYDAETQTLTVTAGERYSAPPDTHWHDSPKLTARWEYSDVAGRGERVNEHCPYLILATTAGAGEYVGHNAFGAEVVVRKIERTEYVLNLLNEDQFPKELRGPLQISIRRPPRVAESLSTHLQMVVAVKLAGYYRSDVFSYEIEPSFDSPEEVHVSMCVIDAKLARVMLMDRISGSIVKQYDIGRN